MITPAHSQIILGMLSTAAHLATQSRDVATSRHQLHESTARLAHERGLFEARAEVMKGLIDALIDKRVSAVRSGFSEVLQLYAEQATRYLDQQGAVSREMLRQDDPLARSEYRWRLNEVDTELRRIRSDARQIYRQMTEIVFLLDGSNLILDGRCVNALAI
ncbi:MAG: hypothetical protein WDM91_10000 [Rhizomicrobium sp.]